MSVLRPIRARHVRAARTRLREDRQGPLRVPQPAARIASPAVVQGPRGGALRGRPGQGRRCTTSSLPTRARSIRRHSSDTRKAAGLDVAKFQPCLTGATHAARIREDLSEAERIGARGTPTFFIGLTVPGDPKVKVIRILRGAQSYAAFREAIDSVLGGELAASKETRPCTESIGRVGFFSRRS